MRENLEDVLGVTFPSPQDSDRDDVSSECIICYSYRLLDGIILFLPLIHKIDLSVLLEIEDVMFPQKLGFINNLWNIFPISWHFKQYNVASVSSEKSESPRSCEFNYVENYCQARKGQVKKAVCRTVFVTMEAVGDRSIPHV